MKKYWDVGYILTKWHGIYEWLFIDLQYEYIDIFVYGNDGVQVLSYYSMITMKELAKWNHRTRCRCFVKLIYWAIPFNVHTPLWTRISEGGWKSHFWGVVCIGILWSLRSFFGVRPKFLNFWGVFVSALWSFF
jgi:hypothetical protein